MKETTSKGNGYPVSKSGSVRITGHFSLETDVVFYHGDCQKFLREIPSNLAHLIVTSPPYNIGKSYEQRLKLEEYIHQQSEVIRECVRVLADDGSICWQVGNYVDNGEIAPLDAILYPVFKSLGLKLRNRIVWRFEHGLHCSQRFSGRYETIMWFTKSNDYVFNLDAVRVPQKYPNKKYIKGPKAGEYSCNPLGKNPGDVWEIPNVKHNHVEKTIHPCQFPVELIERLVLAMTNPGDWVVDPFMGVGTTAVAALIHQRKTAGAEVVEKYVEEAKNRIRKAERGELRVRPLDRPIYNPSQPYTSRPLTIQLDQPLLFERRKRAYRSRKSVEAVA